MAIPASTANQRPPSDTANSAASTKASDNISNQANAEPGGAAAPLPTPGERPGADVVIFDGHCAFCQLQVRRLARWDGGGRLAYLSLHDEATARLYPDLTREQLMREMYVVSPAGRRYGGAAAFRYLSRRLPALWWLAPVLHVPFSLPLWNWCYQRVARRRYQLLKRRNPAACDNDVCEIHFK